MDNKKKQVERETDLFILATEYGIGHSIDEKNVNIPVDFYAPSADIEKVKELKLCNGFRIWIDPDEAKLARASSGGYGMMIDYWLTEGRLELFAKKKGLGLKEYIDETVDLMMDYMEKYGKKVMWNVWPEIDNPHNPYNWGLWPEHFSSRREVYQFLKEHFTTDKYCRHRDKRAITQFDPYIGFKKPAFQYLRERGIDPKKVNLSVLTCRISTCHQYFDWGFSFVQQEANINCSNVQVSIAFLRGAAKQYRGGWGLDPAPWKAPNIYPSVYDTNGNRLGGVSESLLQREWLVCFLSGVNYIGEQVSDSTHWITDRKTKTKHLSPMGRMAQDIADFTLRRYPDRGKTYVPAAILLEKYHGWDCPMGRYGEIKEACMGEIPYESKDDMIEAFFAYAFPGYQEHNRYRGDWWQQVEKLSNMKVFSNLEKGKAKISVVRYNPNYECQKPYGPPKKKSKQKIRQTRAIKEAFRAGLDTRPYEQGELVSSIRGDSFDVFLEDVSLELLKQYPLIILLGGVNLKKDLEKKLRAYVISGGKLIVNIVQVGKENEDFLGVVLTGKRGKTSRARCLLCSQKYDEGKVPFEYEIVKPSSAEVIAKVGHQGRGHPLVTKKTMGKGEIILTTPYFGIKPGRKLHARMLDIVRDTVDHLVQPLMIVEVEGEPLEYLVNLTEQGKIITLVNNTPDCWQGIVKIKDFKASDNLRELWTEKNVFGYKVHNGTAELKLVIPPFMFTIIGAGRY